MFAATSKSQIYHLIDERRAKVTICGNAILNVVLAQPTSIGLCLVNTLPLGFSLCKHCERLTLPAPHGTTAYNSKPVSGSVAV